LSLPSPLTPFLLLWPPPLGVSRLAPRRVGGLRPAGPPPPLPPPPGSRPLRGHPRPPPPALPPRPARPTPPPAPPPPPAAAAAAPLPPDPDTVTGDGVDLTLPPPPRAAPARRLAHVRARLSWARGSAAGSDAAAALLRAEGGPAARRGVFDLENALRR